MNKKKESEKEVMNRLAASCSPGFIVPESSLYVQFFDGHAQS